MRVSVNLNNKVRFVPTQAAHDRYDQYQYELGLRPTELSINKEGLCEMQLWDFMNIFGDMMVIGTDRLPAKGNILEIETD